MDRRHFLASTAAGLASPATLSASERSRVYQLRDLYTRRGDFSDLARDLEGLRVQFEGFMAPPLKADARFFVLTKFPMSVCPFCETAAEWPDDILAVYTKRVLQVVPFNRRIEVSGVLELGAYQDPDTLFVSLVRLADSSYAKV